MWETDTSAGPVCLLPTYVEPNRYPDSPRVLRVTVWLTWKWLLRPLLTTNRTPSICKGNTSEKERKHETISNPKFKKRKKAILDPSTVQPAPVNTVCLSRIPTGFLTFTFAVALLIWTWIWESRIWTWSFLGRTWCLGDGRHWGHSEPWRDWHQSRDPLASCSCSRGRTGGRGRQNTAHNSMTKTDQERQTFHQRVLQFNSIKTCTHTATYWGVWKMCNVATYAFSFFFLSTQY